MEVYVDAMLVKSLKKDDHVSDLHEMFALLRKYNMKLNPAKCAFGVGSRKFLGFMVNHLEQLKRFKWFKIEQVPRVENAEADGLARLASRLDNDALGLTLIELLSEPSIRRSADHVMPVEHTPCWVDPILEYLTKEKIPEDKNEARRIKY